MEDYLTINAWHFLLVFSRMSAMFINMPGIGQMFVPQNVRLFMGLGMTLLILPLVSPSLPPLPSQPLWVFAYIFNEILIGLIIGFTAYLIMSATQTAGEIADMVTGLGMASMMDPSQGQQGAIIGSLLGFMVTLMIFVLDLHHLLFIAVRDSYTFFLPGQWPLVIDLLDMHVQLTTTLFTLGLQMASPFIVMSLIIHGVTGILMRLLPQMQIFFVVQPIQVLIGLFVLAFLLPAMVMWFMQNFEETMLLFIQAP